jgi:plasmid replication initiation protein
MADIDNINPDDLTNIESLKELYIQTVNRGWRDNTNQSVIEFFSYAEKALQDDKHGTPEKLFYHLIKEKNNPNITNAQEQSALLKINATQRQDLINEAENKYSHMSEDGTEEIDEDWLAWHSHPEYDQSAFINESPNYDFDDLESDDDKRILYASDGALTWQELLTNTALLSAGDDGKKLLSKQKVNNFRKYEENPQSQFDFFNASMVDISYKDDISLMDISPFGIGKKPRTAPIEYDLRDALVKVTANAEYGMATIFDYDIVIYMASHLNAQMNDLKRKVTAGEKNPHLPPRKLRVYTSEMFDHLKIDQGGKQYDNLKQKLRRLRGTNIEVDKKIDGGLRREGSFSLIGDWEILSETKSGRIAELTIGYPDWIYDGIVRESDPTLLTQVDDYMLLRYGMHKWLARLAKKSAGMNSWKWTLEQLYERSGSSQPLKNFRIDLIDALEKLKEDPIPEYKFLWEESDTGKYQRRGKGRPKKDFMLTIVATGQKGREVLSDRRKHEIEKQVKRQQKNIKNRKSA